MQQLTNNYWKEQHTIERKKESFRELVVKAIPEGKVIQYRNPPVELPRQRATKGAF